MSLTHRQRDLLRLEVCERAQGRRVTLATIMAALSINRSTASVLRKRLMVRITDTEIDAMLPRDPAGKRLRFIPVSMR